jgi:hypothetical protein
LNGLAHDCGPEDGNGQVRHDPRGPNDTPFGTQRAVSLDGRSLGPHRGAVRLMADPGQKKRDRPKSNLRADVIRDPVLLMPGLRPVSVKGLQAALRAARTLP